MKFVAALLASVSLSALLASAPARAQSAGVVIEATGGYAMGSNDAASDFISSGRPFGSSTSDQSVNPLGGYYAGLRIGKQIMPLWDITARFASTDVKGSANYTTSSDKVGQVNDELAFQTLDLEAGYTPALGNNFDMRFFGGLRGLHYTTTLDALETFDIPFTGTNSYSHQGDFYGVGPRVGLEFSTRFGNSPLGISGMAGGAAIIGNATGSQTSDKIGSIPHIDTGGPRTLIDLEGSLGLDYHISDDVVLTGGYRGEVLSGIGNFDSTGDAQLVHGPFAKIKASF